MSRTAIIAGQGALAPAIAARLEDPVVAALEGFAPSIPHENFRLERLVPFFDWLAERGVDRVTFAGAVRRPRLDPEAFDPRTASLVPRILTAMQSGDDAALREVIALFEEAGFTVAGTEEIAPDLVPGEGILVGEPTAADIADTDRAAKIVEGLGALDLGQGAVVAQGLCLAVETLPGTGAMLDFVAAHRDMRPRPNGPRGVFWKAPKPGQDRRIDLPAIGPETVDQVARAGLAGIAWQAGGVILLEREVAVERARDAGVFLWAR
ncbi:LpxI family protein [Paracoccus xiamenensis]|uniref:LpxI family protein n=1 Tax=Paracoccus xiamenensis TaxID=2714901 RepID=UPI00140CCC6E|nr:UDP-2,3-diacylglucosamine diphosphatase LpxI [Paracoccus xiamenensis]NHF72307.1 LpxI family protein [Paracoccus xiamenensis]